MKMLSCWDKCMELVEPLPIKKHAVAKKILEDKSFSEFLDYCDDNKCFSAFSEHYILVKFGVCDYDAGRKSEYFCYNPDRKNKLVGRIFDYERRKDIGR